MRSYEAGEAVMLNEKIISLCEDTLLIQRCNKIWKQSIFIYRSQHIRTYSG